MKTKSKTKTSGSKGASGQVIHTPFGDINIKIKVGGYKSSEGGTVYEPPVDTTDPSDSEVKTTEA